MNKSIIYPFAIIASLIVMAFTLQNEKPITKLKDGTVVVNTTSIASDVKGFNGTTPLKIYIKKGKIQKIEPLSNNETPKFFKAVENGILNKWNGLSVKQAASLKVDAVSGATYSSNAVIKNVQKGLQYYQNKK